MTSRSFAVKKWLRSVNKESIPSEKRFERTANSQELKDKFAELDKEQLHELNETATIAGRLVTKRGKGKVGFAHLQDPRRSNPDLRS